MKRLIKILAIIFGSFFGLYVAIALVVPLFVDIDQYRPKIEQAANEKLNGKVEIGKLALSLWGQIRIQVDGLRLQDIHGKEVVGVQDAYFHFPLASLLTGSPQLVFKLNKPILNVSKDASGKLNVANLVKENALQQPPAQPSQPGSPSAPPVQSELKLPGLVTRARLGVELTNAQLSYLDETSASKTEIKDLNLILKNISLSHPSDLELWANLNTRVGQAFQLQGLARLTGVIRPELKEGKLDRASVTAHLDMDALEMVAPGTFAKKSGVPLNLDFAASISPQEAKIENLLFKFLNAEVKVSGEVTHLDAKETNTKEAGTQVASNGSVMNLKMESNEIQFKPWIDVVPLLKEYDLGGSARLTGEVQGTSKKLNYRGKLTVTALTAKSPHLKAVPKIDAVLSVVTDEIDQILLTMSAPGNDLRIEGKLISFSKPHLNLEITSKDLDLDQLIIPSNETKSAGAQVDTVVNTQAKNVQAEPQDSPNSPGSIDAKLNPLRENKVLGEFVGNIGMKLNRIQYTGVQVSNFACRLGVKDLAAGWDQCGFNVFSGAIKSDLRVQLKPKTPTYQTNLKVSGLNITEAAQSRLALFKDTVTGTADFNLNADGASLNSKAAMSNLKAHGSLKVNHAQFKTVDVAKMVKEALDKTVAQISDKVPALKGKSLPMQLPQGGSKYEFISSDFTVQGGKLNAPNFYAKAVPNQGIDLKGSTTVGLNDQSLKTTWDVIDTYNLTHARDLSVDIAGKKVEHILAEGNSPVHFVVQAGCTLSAPCYSYSEVPAELTKIAMGNVSKAVTGQAQDALKKQAESAIEKMAPPQMQQKLKDQLKSLFH